MAVENPMLPLLDALIPGNAAWPSASLALLDVGPFLDSLTEDEREWLDGLACGLTHPPPIARRQLLAAEVDPKGGCDRITWDASAQLVWSDDLAQDNTLLCRMAIKG